MQRHSCLLFLFALGLNLIGCGSGGNGGASEGSPSSQPTDTRSTETIQQLPQATEESGHSPPTITPPSRHSNFFKPSWFEKIIPDPTRLPESEKMPTDSTLVLRGIAAQYLYQEMTAIIPKTIESAKNKNVILKSGWNIHCLKSSIIQQGKKTLSHQCVIPLNLQNQWKNFFEFLQKNAYSHYQRAYPPLRHIQIHFAQGELARSLYEKMNAPIESDNHYLLSLTTHLDTPFDLPFLKPVLEAQGKHKAKFFKTKHHLGCLRFNLYAENQPLYTCFIQVKELATGQLFLL